MTRAAYLRFDVAARGDPEKGGRGTRPGSGNAGAFVWVSTAGNSNLIDNGPFTNSGTFTDLGAGQVQQIQVPDFINTGVVTSASEGMRISGSKLFTNRGTVRVTAKGTFASSGTVLLEPAGKIQTAGAFDLAGSVFDVAGDSVVEGALVSPYNLGVGPTTVILQGRPSEELARNDQDPGALEGGTVPKAWKLVVDGGQITR